MKPALHLPRSPYAHPEPALDGLAIHPQFTRNLLNSFAPVLARDHLAYQASEQKPVVFPSTRNSQCGGLAMALFIIKPTMSTNCAVLIACVKFLA
jgi:hypothetical protein